MFSLMLVGSLFGPAGSVGSLETFISSLRTLMQAWLADSRMDVRARMPPSKFPILGLEISPTNGKMGAKM